MASESLKLLTPVKALGRNLQNRVALAPLTRGRAGNTRVANEWQVEYYTARAETGLLITEGTHPSLEGVGWVDSPGIWTAEHAAGWKTVTDAVHARGGTIVVQLWHQGRTAHPDFTGMPPVAPSALAADAELHTPAGTKVKCVEPRALETEEIPRLVQDFAKAAGFAKEAGFDGVEIHCANGYLLDTFLQSSTNKRTDQYGGSLENRFRVVSEILDAVYGVFAKEQVGVRFSPNGGYNDMGSEDNKTAYVEFARMAAEKGVGYLHVMDGLAFGYHEKCPAVTLADIRPVFPGTIIANCGYTKETAEEAVQSGNADLVAFGRPFLANPDLVARFRNGWPLSELDGKLWFSHGAEGYVDQKPYSPSE